MPTTPTENYLIAIQTLRDEGMRCIPARIAERLHVSAPSVTEALKRMEKAGYITYSDEREVVPTDEGHAIALKLLHHHRLIERWLTDVLGLDWATAHEEAHHLEHAISDRVAERLWASMNYPKSCPHGNPIVEPSADARAAAAAWARLSEIPQGQSVTVRRISELAEDSHDLMGYFERQGFRPGTTLSVLDRGPLNDTLIVQIADGATALSNEVASFVWVAAADETATALRPAS